MYYKIENKESGVYKKLYEIRKDELRINDENEQAIKEKIPYDWNEFLGNNGQQGFIRTRTFHGFVFLNPDEVDLKVWKKDTNGAFIPNRRTKAGREISSFLNGLPNRGFFRVEDSLGLSRLYGKITLPYLEIGKDSVILLYLDNRHRPEDPNVIEITRAEFEQLNK